ncbi:MAG: argininosuccinate lyase [bacterium]
MAQDGTVDTFRRRGSRLTEAIDPTLQQVSYPGPWEHMRHGMPAIHAFDKAHCLMLVEEGIIPRAIGRRLLAGLREMEREGMLEARRSVGASNHSGELWLTKRLGEEVAGWLHVGRSSGDLGAVSDSVTARAKLLDVWERLLVLRATLLTLAAKHLDTVMPGYSGAQHAQPVTFGFHLHSWEEAFRRDTERIGQAYARINLSPAGAAIMTGSDFNLNRQRVADLLGFDGLRMNNHDAIFHIDHLVEAASVLTVMMSNAGRLADELHLWATSEFNMVSIPDRYCITSSIMPQKKNPWSTVYIRGQSARTMGRLAAVLALVKARQDEFDAEHYVAEELWQMMETDGLSLEFLDGTLARLEVNRDLMKQRAGAYWATATDVASLLVREKRLPWRTSHQIVAVLVRLSQERGIKPQDVTGALLDEAAVAHSGKPLGVSDAALRAALDPVHFVNARTMTGGPAPARLKPQIGESEKALAGDRAVCAGARERLAEAARRLEAGIDAALAD